MLRVPEDKDVGVKVYFIKQFIKDKDYLNKMSEYEFDKFYSLLKTYADIKYPEMSMNVAYNLLNLYSDITIDDEYKLICLNLLGIESVLGIGLLSKKVNIFSNFGDMAFTEIKTGSMLDWLNNVLDKAYREYVHKQTYEEAS